LTIWFRPPCRASLALFFYCFCVIRWEIICDRRPRQEVEREREIERERERERPTRGGGQGTTKKKKKRKKKKKKKEKKKKKYSTREEKGGRRGSFVLRATTTRFGPVRRTESIQQGVQIVKTNFIKQKIKKPFR
jgi:hypothetical protein